MEEKKHPTYAERRTRIVEQIVAGYSAPYALALAEVMMSGNLVPQAEADFEPLAASLCYLRLMRGNAEGLIAHAEGLQTKTLLKWKEQIDFVRQERIDKIRKYQPDFVPYDKPKSPEVIKQLAAALLTAQEAEDRARSARYKVTFEFIRAVGGTI